MVSPPPVPTPGSLSARAWNLVTALHVRAYRLTGGRIGGRTMGVPTLLLDHLGRKSGDRRTAPLLYIRDGENLVIVASRGGSKATPAWWYNLEAQPDTEVQVGSERRAVRARTTHGEERRRLWPKVVAAYQDYETYQRRTSREIPVVVLEPR